MGAFRSASFFWICFLVCSSESQKIIPAKHGQDVILPCKVPNNNNIHINNIRAVEWSRSGLDPEYVLLYRDGHFDPDYQHASYQNRVDLQDKEMKDGDFSLILKNVTKNDTGTYVCHVFEKGTNRRKRSNSEPISNIYLKVVEPGKNSGIIVGLVVGVILLLAAASLGFLIYKRRMRKNPNLSVSPDEAAAEQML